MTTIEKLDAKNAKFAKLTKPQKRVAIAKDALMQLRLKRVKAAHMIYVGSNDVVSIYPRDINGNLREADDRQLCDLIPKMANCKACALGTLFLAGVSCKDNLTVSAIRGMAMTDGTQGALQRYLGDTFAWRQLRLIEDHFEAHWHCGDPDATLRAILNNIVCNKGTFKPKARCSADFVKHVLRH
jgi:hypothetical protein